MSLQEVYKEVRKAIIGFVPKYYFPKKSTDKPPQFPPIIGTGFIIADGIAVTNQHVIDSLEKLERHPDRPHETQYYAFLFVNIPNRGWGMIHIDVLGFASMTLEVPGYYYGPKSPDLALVHLKAKGLPVLKVSTQVESITEGLSAATAGYPMGSDSLMLPGYLHQLTPMLQAGVISAVLPFPCQAPHAYVLNVMSPSGASGSPVFETENGHVIGMLYRSMKDVEDTDDGSGYYVPTSFTYAVPSHYIAHVLAIAKEDPLFKLPDDTKSLEEMIRDYEIVVAAVPGQVDPEKRTIIPPYRLES